MRRESGPHLRQGLTGKEVLCERQASSRRGRFIGGERLQAEFYVWGVSQVYSIVTDAS